MRLVLALVMLAVFPNLAFAHSGPEHALGFVHGFEHPVGGLDHLLAMVAVGVFAFVLGGRALWAVPLSFVAMMIVGFGAGVAGVPVPFVELGIAVSSVLIGGAAALGRPMPVAAAMGLVGVFALFHGHAHGAEMPGGANGLDYVAGFTLATASLHLAGMAASLTVARLAGRFGAGAARLAGGGFALAGLGAITGWI
ncbi:MULTISPECIES: HupE/UreJ family protein [unclassified Devosia]|uniref:HupE/UreJ family protein n=1 Tax=unclassified Devosia TaxID=196773 RepID=UPI0015577808|nr:MULTISPECIES: HupE/UreJ family protein [unclassified Devosia]